MIWISNIYDLQYYKQKYKVPCYCEFLVYPQDLQLQSHIATSSSTSMTISVYTSDGTTNLGDVTSYFEYYFAINPVTGQRFFNARLKSFAGLMCANPCFILRVQAADVFDKYTERYCQASCCDRPRDISISQDGLKQSDTFISALPDRDIPPIPIASLLPQTTNCNEPIIRLVSWFDCYDNFTGEYYGDSGGWAFRKISNFKGKFVKRPRNIERQISYNCRVQRSESYNTWALIGFEFFPAWKMRDIENQLHANHIQVTDFVMQQMDMVYAGGTPFTLINECIEMFRLNVTLQECTQRQIFGCNEPCNNNGSLFALPDDYVYGNGIYDENGLLIARSYEDLLLWFRNQDQITQVIDLTGQYSSPATSPLDCFPQGAFYVQGNGLIPTFFYYNSKTPGNKVYGIPGIDPELLCTGNDCAIPEIGNITFEDGGCAIPDIGDYYIEEYAAIDIEINDTGDWLQNDTDTNASLLNNSVTFRLNTENRLLTGDENIIFGGERIGIMPVTARPQFIRTIEITSDTYVIVDTAGNIYYYGVGITTATETTIIIPYVNYYLI